LEPEDEEELAFSEEPEEEAAGLSDDFSAFFSDGLSDDELDDSLEALDELLLELFDASRLSLR
jgi:hypothetical protein